jgi:long-chain-fatty-acid--[acyl-carrier-protein] ligase
VLGKDLGQLEDGPPDAFLISVYRAMLGEAKSAADKLPIDVRYFRYSDSSSPLEIPAGGNILSVLFRKASENPDAAWMADENSGVVTYRQGIGKILVLARAVRKMRGERIGLMLPPSVGGVLFFFATLQAGKTPVEVNYTAGNENLLHSMNLVEAQTVVTSRQFVGKLGEKNYGIDAIQDRFLYTEDLAQSIQERSIANAWNLFMNGLAINRARFKALWPRGWLRRSRAPAVILSTSGSSGLPKAVELSDANLLSNVRAITPLFGRAKSDSMTSFAPFFHSLGVTGTIVLPALSGLRVNYVANATDGPGIALAIASYSSTMMIGPPSLLQQIFASASADFFAPLRLIVTGAEKLLPSTAAFLAAKAPGAKILEGAGTTEASPVWAVTAPDDIRPGFVGKILPTISYLIVDHDSLDLAVEAGDPSRARLAEPAADGSLDGELLLSGDSVIERYYAGAKPEAFVVLGGRRYFRTGDRVVAMPDRFAKILGRFTRQHKAPGGEMINHEMAEAAISDVPQLKPGADGKQSFFVGVAALPEGELATALLTTRDVGLGDVNPSIVRQLSATWAIKKIFRVAEIPLLGTGKTNQRACQEMIDAKARAEAP